MHPARLFGLVLLLSGCAQATSYPDSAAAPAGAAGITPVRSAGLTAAIPGAQAREGHLASKSPISLSQRHDHATRTGPQWDEGSPGDNWSYQVATEVASSRNPKPASYLRVRNAYSTPIMATADWRFWNNAYDEQQRDIGTSSVQTDVRCSFVECTRSETFDVALTAAQLRHADDVRLRLTSKSGEEKLVTLSAKGRR